MLFGLGLPAIVSFLRFHDPAVPFLHGVARVTPPASSVLFTAKTATGPSRFALVVPLLRGTTLHPVLRSPPGLMLPERAWSPIPGPRRRFSVETCSSPRFLGDPRVCLPCSSTPTGPPHLAFAARRCCPRSSHDEGTDDYSLSKLSHTAFTLAVYASQAGSPRHHARLASGWWLASTGWDLNP